MVVVMVTGAELKRARGRLRLTQSQLADMLGVSRRTVAEWEATSELSQTIAGRLSAVIADSEPDTPGGAPLASVSDLELVTEMGRRLASLRNQISEQKVDVPSQPDESLENGHQTDERHISSPQDEAYPSDGGSTGAVGTEINNDAGDIDSTPRFSNRGHGSC